MRLTIREALEGIINAANGHPDPIHYKVREAIAAARDAIRAEDEEDEEHESRVSARHAWLYRKRKHGCHGKACPTCDLPAPT